jgi:hypothetical protein
MPAQFPSEIISFEGLTAILGLIAMIAIWVGLLWSFIRMIRAQLTIPSELAKLRAALERIADKIDNRHA